MPSKDKYTDPKLRDEVKEEIHNSDKGGAPGQWSARKAQMMASEYKKRGGGYTTDKNDKDESQQHLENWGKEDWQTKEGDGNAKQEDGSRKRYLPKKAWENMSEQEKKETDDKKQSQSKKGQQYVENTDKAKSSRKKASKDEKDDEEKQAASENSDDENEDSQPDDGKDDGADDDEEKEADGEDEDTKDEQKDTQSGQKRSRGKQSDSPSKKQKSNSGKSKSKTDQDADSEQKDSKNNKATVGSKHMDAKEPAQKGSADRLPKKNQMVQWRAMPGYVSGKLVEVLHNDKTIDGKSHKASEEAPKLVLKSDSSGKICVHKPETCFYD